MYVNEMSPFIKLLTQLFIDNALNSVKCFVLYNTEFKFAAFTFNIY